MKRIMMIVGVQVAVLAGLSGLAVAQTQVTVEAKPLTDSDIALLRHDVQGQKMEIITKTMQFTDAEGAAFWPVYRNYVHDQNAVGDQEYQMIKDYAQNYGQMSDAKAAELAQKMFDLEQARHDNEVKYWPQFQKALTAKRAAKFYQVDRRLTLMIDLQIASEVPLMQ
jgi:Spy/CpxP family protein refolding chaperone